MDRNWNRLLQFAASSGHRDLAALALNQGAAADQTFDDGTRALVCAAREGHVDVVQLLLMRGARTGILDALVAASDGGHSAVVRALTPLAAAEIEMKRVAEVAAAQPPAVLLTGSR